MSKAIFWFRNDLRLKDNTALNKALNENSEVLPVYIIDPALINSQDTGSAKIKFIFDSLRDISEKLTHAKSKLIIRFGKSDEQLIKLAQELDIKKIYFNRIYDIDSEYIDEKIKPLLENFSLEVFNCKDCILFDKEELYSKDFEEYSTKWKSKYKKYKLPEFEKTLYQNFIKREENILSLAVPSLEDYGVEHNQNFPIGSETQVSKILRNNLTNQAHLDFSDIIAPYFEIGNISIRQIIKFASDNPNLKKEFIDKLIKYNYFSFYNFEYTQNKNNTDYNKFLIWCRGETGNPIVDACIKQINNECIVNSKIFSYVLDYLVNNLEIDLKWIARYLNHKLVNTSNTYFKMLLSHYTDKINYNNQYVNNYIKNYLPVLKNVPDIYLQIPHEMPLSLQHSIKCIIGKDYPFPLYNENFYQEINIDK